MKTFLATILCTASLICAAPEKPDTIPTHLKVAIQKSSAQKETAVTVVNSIADIGFLLDIPDASIEKFNKNLPLITTRVNGEVINLGESKEVVAGSMILVSVELPAKACSELLQKANIFTKVVFSSVAWATHLKVLFLVPVDSENPEIDLLQHLVAQIEKWEVKTPHIKANFKAPFGVLLTLS